MEHSFLEWERGPLSKKDNLLEIENSVGLLGNSRSLQESQSFLGQGVLFSIYVYSQLKDVAEKALKTKASHRAE